MGRIASHTSLEWDDSPAGDILGRFGGGAPENVGLSSTGLR